MKLYDPEAREIRRMRWAAFWWGWVACFGAVSAVVVAVYAAKVFGW